MAIIRVTKLFSFEMAHALWNYDGPCKNIHGHSYKLYITVKGTPLYDPDSHKHGMIIDFGDLKKIVNKHVVKKYDHSLLISEMAENDFNLNVNQMFSKLVVVPYQPTCENLVLEFSSALKQHLPPQVELVCLKLYETETSYAEWMAEDNIS